MEPISLGLGLVHHLGQALFHAAVHIAGHETFHTIKHRFSHHWLRNHDVSRALNESYIAALGILERDFRAKVVDPAQRELGARALDRLRSQAARLFPALEGPAALTESEAADLIHDPGTLDATVKELIAVARPVPAELRVLIEESLADAMAFTFKELGLKQNEKVRAVLQHEMLAALKESAALQSGQLDQVRQDLSEMTSLLEKQESMRRFQERFHESIASGLRDLSTQVSRVASGQDELKVMLQMALEGEGPALAYVAVSDGSGNRLARHPLRTSVSTIGRDPDNTIQLSHGSVSGRHAEIKSEGGFFTVRDLGSRNGTYLDADPGRIRSKLITFGQKLRIGTFVLEFQSPEAGLKPTEPPATIPV
jgi:hypothetical protein